MPCRDGLASFAITALVMIPPECSLFGLGTKRSFSKLRALSITVLQKHGDLVSGVALHAGYGDSLPPDVRFSHAGPREAGVVCS